MGSLAPYAKFVVVKQHDPGLVCGTKNVGAVLRRFHDQAVQGAGVIDRVVVQEES